MIKILQRSLKHSKFSPDNIPLKKYLGQLLLQSGKTSESIQYFEEVLKHFEDDLDCRLQLARTYYDLGKFEQVKQVLEQADKHQVSGEMYLLLSKACFSLEDYELAGKYYEAALDSDPSLEDKDYQEELFGQNIKVKAKLRVVEFKGRQQQDDLFEQPQLTFQDIGGLEELKENIRMNIIYPFQNPDLFRSYGKKVGGGLLLYGPPGCGKTFIARATAGECHANFVSINIHDILDMYIGQSEKNLHEIFERAREKTPTIIFIDELDAIGGSRQQSQSSYTRSLTNQLLSELDGIHSNNNEILVLGATNTPWFVDSAMRRPGRFDRVLFVAPPDLEARVEILHIHLRDKPVENIDYVKAAKKMEKYSGADIQAVCNLATDEAIQAAMKTGKRRNITTEDLLKAIKKVKPSTLEWLATAKNYATYSNESGIYDDILAYIQKR
ncbi:AAA family ATPase [Paenactinomyces guangxiensis]|uniref:ATP-binding protein n=1 Tax=Paenactinomyces guangxiensis TaxID=1490290 RepID=UPI0018DBC653|nr:ATP-binding protein [Paenactinomyces guangxiensis]MBH8593256.1 AAA family ATPase [Paenactinomyces guangxiensis]